MFNNISDTPKTVLFYGMSGAGKGTQAKLLVKKLQEINNTHFIETGQLLRDYATKAGTCGAMRIKETIDSGHLVPQAVSSYMWSGILLKSVGAHHNVVFDGAARSIREAELFHDMLVWLGREYTIFVLEIDKELARERAIERGEGRVDDNDISMKNRLKWFTEQTLPAIEYMKTLGAKVYYINGAESVGDIHKEILDKLNI